MFGIVNGADLSQSFRNGWAPTQVVIAATEDVPQSQRVREMVQAVPSQCYWNARRAIMRFKEFADATYVEGWAYTRYGLAIEHAWIVHNGVLIDPTLPGDCEAYWPGLEFQGRDGIKDFLAKAGNKYRRSPFFYAFGWGGNISPTFAAAAAAANQYMFARLHSKRKPHRKARQVSPKR
jgi:hypothetical protein